MTSRSPGRARRKLWTQPIRYLTGALSGLAFAALAASYAAAGSGLTVEILHPAVGEPLLGEVEIVVAVHAEGTHPQTSDHDVASSLEVEAFLDGESLGTRQGPPWRWRVDVGLESREHRVDVVARTAEGEETRAVRFTPWVRIDHRVEAELQTLYVTVTDGHGRRVAQLPRSAFRIRDDGEAQRIVTFEHGDLPLTAFLLLDTSISMAGERFEAARSGVQAFLSGLRKLDEVRVLAFSDRLRALSPFVGVEPVPQLPARLRELEAGDGTAVHDHLFLALHRLEAHSGRRVVVLLSDGVDRHSVLEVEEVQRVARRSRALIYWVRLEGTAEVTRHNIAPSPWGTPKQRFRSFRRLEEVVQESGGRIVRLLEPGEIEGAFRDILRELREQYALGYYPQPRLRHDGGWREVEVELPTSRGWTARTRAGYVDRRR